MLARVRIGCARIGTSSRIVRSKLCLENGVSGKTFPALSRHYASGVSPNDVFLQGSSPNYIDEMYHSWKKDPNSVHVSWQAYFKNMDAGVSPTTAFIPPPSLVPPPDGGIPIAYGHDSGFTPNVQEHLKVQLLVRAYQVRGHLKAKLDPLGITLTGNLTKVPKELTLEYYGFTENDLDKEYDLGPGILPRFALKNNVQKMTLRQIIETCEKIYCSRYGVEYIHIPDRDRCDWIRDRIEIPNPIQYSLEEKKQIFDRLAWSTQFEAFLAHKFPNDKRFGLEGAESMIPGMKALIDRSVEDGVEDIIIGMPHRGRLNMLSNVVRKPNECIFAEFTGSASFDEGSGDVKYHLGMNYERPTPSGKRVRLSLVANPSHLEAEDPVVLGQTRAIQNSKKNNVKSAMGILLHGDAAFAAQGVVYETFGLNSLPDFSTGGTVHIIVNNQIGFTTDPRFARSTPYPSDIAKSESCPIFHVNGDDVEAVTFICQLAADWRKTFHSDVIIDIVCYRKHGHNETDQPSFTQPRMYKRIAQMKPIFEKYTEQLIAEKSFTKEEVEKHKEWVWSILEDNFQNAKNYKAETQEWVAHDWAGFKTPKELATEVLPHLPTAIDESVVKHVGSVISSAPEGFHVHRNLKRILNSRLKSIETGENIDWATGEALAYGSLVLEGFNVRVSGQDVQRGTFSQRHAVLHDQENENTYTPLEHVGENQANFSISNSSLSEYGVMGFEYGYSLPSPDNLVVWEAQFGDFANNASCIIDQFIAAGECKWLQRSGLTLSLPHGYDGQGPEHSSGRLERYLQLANEDPRIYPSADKLDRQHQDCNIQIVYPTTPANIFHLLRRQMHRQFRKPLIMFFSKSLLRHPLARSNISEFTGDSSFKWIIPEDAHGAAIGSKQETKRLVFCSGQVWTALVKRREAEGIKDTAFIKIEQLHPFPWALLKEEIESYPNLQEIVWCQEEPLNAGAWSYVQPRLHTLLAQTPYKDLFVRYAGRDPNASVAAGTKKQHNIEEDRFLKEVFDLA